MLSRSLLRVARLSSSSRISMATPAVSSSIVRPVATAATAASDRNPKLVAVGQMNSGANIEDNFKAAADLVARAAAHRASLLCLPECFAFIGASTGASLAMAEPLTGPLMTRYCQLAKQHRIWLSLGGFQEKSTGATANTHVHNAHVIVNDQGQIVNNYHKVHLFDVDAPGASHRESSYTAGGNKLVVADSPVGKLGLSVCYDVRFPELYAGLSQLGAQVLLVPAAFTLRTGLAHWQVLLRARAIENQAYVVAAAQHGVHNVAESKDGTPGPLRESFGNACIIDPWGAIIAQCSEGVGLAFAEIDIERMKKIRASMPVATHHKPDVYRGILPGYSKL